MIPEQPSSGRQHLITYDDLKVKNLADLPRALTSRMELYADTIIINPHISPIEAYQKVYKCAKLSAAKNYKRVYNLPQFQEYIKVMKTALTEHLGISEEQIIAILSARAKSKITDIAQWDKYGTVTYIPSDQIDDTTALCIKKFEVTERPILGSDGNPKYDKGRIVADRRIKVEMRDSDKAIDMLGKYLNLWAQGDPETGRREALLARFMSIVHDKDREKQ